MHILYIFHNIYNVQCTNESYSSSILLVVTWCFKWLKVGFLVITGELRALSLSPLTMAGTAPGATSYMLHEVAETEADRAPVAGKGPEGCLWEWVKSFCSGKVKELEEGLYRSALFSSMRVFFNSNLFSKSASKDALHSGNCKARLLLVVDTVERTVRKNTGQQFWSWKWGCVGLVQVVMIVATVHDMLRTVSLTMKEIKTEWLRPGQKLVGMVVTFTGSVLRRPPCAPTAACTWIS